MQSVLVTGGAGFIGSNFVRHLLGQTDARVVVLDKLTYAGHRENLDSISSDPRFCFVEGDIADAACVERVFREQAPSAVVNFAAESHVDRSIDSPRVFIDTNIVGTFELLEASRRRADELGDAFRFLHVSTDEVFGSLGPSGSFTEQTPYAPNSPYAATKASADHLVRAYHHTYRLPTLLTNCSNNYGPYQFPEKLIPLMILNAIEGRPLPIYGDGQNVRDWLYVVDHCSGILRVLQSGTVGESYNIGGNEERTNIEVVDTLCEILDRLDPRPTSRKELKTFVEDRKGHDRRYAIDATRIRDKLDWAPEFDFATGMEATIRWYLDHQDWCQAVQSRALYRRERLGLNRDD